MIPTTDLQQKLFSNKCKLIKLGGEPISTSTLTYIVNANTSRVLMLR